jgi:5'-3' exoribonuclease 1
MGIPSYYKTLITKIPHAIDRKVPSDTNTLVIDMNCMIYHVLREPKMSALPFPGEEGRLAWEKRLQEEVCLYLTHIWRSAGAPGQVYVALDGVVPYAKIKQQRFRRFKSASLGSKDGAWGANPTWDTNSITPGTQFMASMGLALKEAGKKHGWIISDTDEPGEGEHKVLQWLLSRKLKEGGIVVYGLDADLILLCLIAGNKLGPKFPIYLLREAMAFGKLVRLQGSLEVDLCFFKISTLKDSLQKGTEWSKEQFYDYVFGMSFCGNDFLPTGLSLRIRDEGHSILLSGLNEMWKRNQHLVILENDIVRPNPFGLKFFANWMSQQEESLILTTIKRKMTARPGEDEADNIAIREQAEKPMIFIKDKNILLRRTWHSTYSRLALGEDSVEKRKMRVSDFWRGWCWILDYYQGRRVDLEWVYPEGYPPTWSDLVQFFELPQRDDWQEREILKPQEQLALVLPMSSWGLLLKTAFRDLPAKMPQYWPQGFGFETFAKRFGWECEPMIPILSPSRLRHEVQRMNIYK